MTSIMPERWGMAIKVDRCFGCKVCVVACKSENYAQFSDASEIVEDSPLFWVRIHTEFSGSYPRFQARYYPLICRHCRNPLCREACPRLAIQARPDGIVSIDRESCDGCQACIAACPYNIPQLNIKTGKVEMCHLCMHRLEQGKEPICVIACPSKALVFGDLNDRSSEVSRLLATRQPIPTPADEITIPSVHLLSPH